MQVVPCAHGLEAMVGKSILPRSPGLHISEIYGDLFRRLEPTRYSGDAPNPLHLELGLSWETILEEGLRTRLGAFRPGEIVSPEGIILSPDLLIPEDDRRVRVGEIKLTYMSCREMPTTQASSLPPKFSKWEYQIKAYAHILGTPLARLLVLFVNGDYRPPQPRLLAYDLEFTERELVENWRTLMTHARVMGVL